jgi:hypothetical protein
MWQNIGGNNRTVASATTSIERSRSSIIVPSPDVWAILKFGNVPTPAPDELVPYTMWVDDDWVLTDDVLAFGARYVIQHFSEWRSSWERTWTLEPLDSLLRLFDMAYHLAPEADAPSRRFERLMRYHRREDGDVVIPPTGLADCRAALSQLAELVRTRNEQGFGLIDLTPGAARVGLAKAWSSWGTDEIVAAAEGLEVILQPSTGLHVRVTTSDGSTTALGPIDHVEFTGERCSIHSESDAVTVSISQARALSWLVPGSTGWRIRRIPETVAWAKTFAGLDECLTEAIRLHAPVRLTSRRPIADISARHEPT